MPPQPTSPFVHRELDFYQTSDNFYLVPLKNAAANQKGLVINRQTEEVTVSEGVGAVVASLYPSRRVHGVFGSIRLIAGKYLLLVSRVAKIGEIMAEPIYRVKAIEMIPYHHSELHLTEEQKRFNTQYIAMVQSFLQSDGFHLSYSYDLSRTLQSRYQKNRELENQKALFERADGRFVWNQALVEDLFGESGQKDLDAFCLPVIFGFIVQYPVVVNGKNFLYTLISRRAAEGAGTRLFYRGVNHCGHVANYVETEQIICYPNGAASSYVQIRGSIPLHWSQYPDLRYKPPPTINHDLPNAAHFLGHLQSVLSETAMYESLVMLNLIDHHGPEEALLKKLHSTFGEISYQLAPKKVYLESFDFHRECRANRWDRLSLLLDKVAHHIDKFGYFSTTERDTYQQGVFRTNCVDSLDRTNVVQSLLAKCSLEQQLTHFGIISHGQKVEDFDGLWHMFRNVWADNADAISTQYAGTPALKTDFTRTGKRRLYGKLQDGLNSAIRYYKNNFEDGFRQDAYELFLGRYRVQADESKSADAPSPLARRNMLKIVAFPMFLLLSLSLLFFVIFYPSERSSEKAVNLLLWAALSAGVTVIMLQFGKQFVDNPTLAELPPVRGSSRPKTE